MQRGSRCNEDQDATRIKIQGGLRIKIHQGSPKALGKLSKNSQKALLKLSESRLSESSLTILWKQDLHNLLESSCETLRKLSGYCTNRLSPHLGNEKKLPEICWCQNNCIFMVEGFSDFQRELVLGIYGFLGFRARRLRRMKSSRPEGLPQKYILYAC